MVGLRGFSETVDSLGEDEFEFSSFSRIKQRESGNKVNGWHKLQSMDSGPGESNVLGQDSIFLHTQIVLYYI